MSQPPLWRRYLRFLGSDPASDLDDEIRAHLELRAERLVRDGWEPAAARAEAERRFGDVAAVRRECRRIDGRRERRRRLSVWLDGLRQDVRYAVRALRRNPAFTVIAAGTLGLGIGSSVAMFGVVDALFMRPPAGVSEPERVVLLHVVRNAGNIQTPDGGSASYPDYEALAAGRLGIQAAAAHFSSGPVDLGRGEEAVRATGQVVTPRWFSVLGVRPHRGRLFLEEDGRTGAEPAIVLSHRYWRRAHGGDPAAIGRSLRVNGTLGRIVGVAAPGFAGIGVQEIDLWIASGAAESLGLAWEGWTTSHTSVMLGLVARLAPASNRTAVEAAAAAALRPPPEHLAELDPTPGVIATGLNLAELPGGFRIADLSLWLALATGLVLVICTANVANLLLGRTASRRREIAIRVALGVGRGRLLRTLLLESVLLTAFAGVLALGVAALGLGMARALPLPPGTSALHPRLLAASLLAVIATTLAVTAAPALRMLRMQPSSDLRGGGGDARRQHRTRAALVGAQVAFATVALVGAGLFVRSLAKVAAIQPGVDLERIAVVTVDLKQAGMAAPERRAFQRAALERLGRLPGVVSASIASQPPLAGIGMALQVGGAGGEPIATQEGPYFITVGEDYFRTAGIPVRRGRAFTAEDRGGARPVAIVNERLARVLAPGGAAVGACLRIGDRGDGGGCTEIVGVVGDNLHRLFDEDPVPYVFVPALDTPGQFDRAHLLVVRTAGPAAAELGRIRSAVQSMSPDLPFVNVIALPEVLQDELLPFRLGAYLSAAFGALALLITAVGLYGVLAYLIAQRTVEIGIRRALGATNAEVARLVAGGAATPVAAGAAAGLAAALAGGRVVASLLYSTAPRDAGAVAAALFLVALTAGAAAFVPARRALRVDPAVALRGD